MFQVEKILLQMSTESFDRETNAHDTPVNSDANDGSNGEHNNRQVSFSCLTHFCPPLRFRNQVPAFAVRETDVSA